MSEDFKLTEEMLEKLAKAREAQEEKGLKPHGLPTHGTPIGTYATDFSEEQRAEVAEDLMQEWLKSREPMPFDPSVDDKYSNLELGDSYIEDPEKGEA